MKVKLFVSCLPHDNRVAVEIHDSIGSCVVHFAIIEELMVLENRIPLLPCLDALALFEEKSMAVRLSDTEGTEADIVGRPREMDSLLNSRGQTTTILIVPALTRPERVAASVNT